MVEARDRFICQAVFEDAYSAQFGQAFRSIPAGYSGHCGRGRSEATLEFVS
jgi:hypothetical protein